MPTILSARTRSRLNAGVIVTIVPSGFNCQRRNVGYCCECRATSPLWPVHLPRRGSTVAGRFCFLAVDDLPLCMVASDRRKSPRICNVFAGLFVFDASMPGFTFHELIFAAAIVVVFVVSFLQCRILY